MGCLKVCEQFRSITTRNFHPSENPICNICIAILSVIYAIVTFYKTSSLEHRACSPKYRRSCLSWTSRRHAPILSTPECLWRRGQEEDAALRPPADSLVHRGVWRRHVEGICSATCLTMQRQALRNPGIYAFLLSRITPTDEPDTVRERGCSLFYRWNFSGGVQRVMIAKYFCHYELLLVA